MNFFYENKDLSIHARNGKNLAFKAHLHSHIELVYMIDGRSKALVDFKEYIISPGDILVVFPNKIHQYQKIDKENYFISILPPDLFPEFQNLFKTKVPVSPLLKNASENKELLPITQKIVNIVNDKPEMYDTLLKGHYLILLSELFKMMEFEEAAPSDSETIKIIMNYCAENYTKDIQLDTIAKELHINKYYISHLFTKKLNMCFKDYIGMLRISDACRLLKTEDMSITDIAYNVGFNTIRSFNRVFLKSTGMTPRQYKTKGSVSKL